MADRDVMSARRSYEACRNAQAGRWARLAELEDALARCEKAMALEQRISDADVAIEEAAAAIDEAAAAIHEAAAAMSGLDDIGPEGTGPGGPERQAAAAAVSKARSDTETARAAAGAARRKLEAGDLEGAGASLGDAEAAAGRAKAGAQTARAQAGAARTAKDIADAAAQAEADDVPKPAPRRPVSITSQRQVLFHANTVLAHLNVQGFLSGGRRCDCPRLALVAAQRANDAVANELFGMLIDVMASPFKFNSVPKGLGIASRATPLGVDIATAFLKSVAADADFGEGAASAAFGFMGGETFPELVGNDFVGGKVNELAQGSLEELADETGKIIGTFERTGVDVDCQDRGDTKRTVDVATSFMANPETGWVVLVIRADDCPPVLVKYRVADGAVPLLNAQPGYGGPEFMVLDED